MSFQSGIGAGGAGGANGSGSGSAGSSRESSQERAGVGQHGAAGASSLPPHLQQQQQQQDPMSSSVISHFELPGTASPSTAAHAGPSASGAAVRGAGVSASGSGSGAEYSSYADAAAAPPAGEAPVVPPQSGIAPSDLLNTSRGGASSAATRERVSDYEPPAWEHNDGSDYAAESDADRRARPPVLAGSGRGSWSSSAVHRQQADLPILREKEGRPRAHGSDDGSSSDSEHGSALPPALPAHASSPTVTQSLFAPGLSFWRRASLFGASLAINFGLPFLNGVMIGFGEIFARSVLAPRIGFLRNRLPPQQLDYAYAAAGPGANAQQRIHADGRGTRRAQAQSAEEAAMQQSAAKHARGR